MYSREVHQEASHQHRYQSDRWSRVAADVVQCQGHQKIHPNTSAHVFHVEESFLLKMLVFQRCLLRYITLQQWKST